MGAWRAAALATEFGFAVVGSMLGGVLGGQFLDRHLGTAPLFFLIGLVVGLIVSVYLMYAIYRLQVQPARRAERSGDGGGAAPAGAARAEPAAGERGARRDGRDDDAEGYVRK
ncbi:MAG TPA: AtpZ/AtpI family protein [Chloroflexota bacterium]|jgi:ATP synthase protein I|nr:AtpZ/AtpI family protein [Chloroflexota bacterium]